MADECARCGALVEGPHFRLVEDGGPVHDKDGNVRTVPCEGLFGWCYDRQGTHRGGRGTGDEGVV